ncbi:hypothetical protein ABPG72_020851 [Tetrahymena utriculariae]
MEEDNHKNRILSEERKWLIIIANKYFHLNQSEICNGFSFNKGTCIKLLKKYNQQGNVQNNHSNSGRQSIVSEYSLIKTEIADIIQKDSQCTVSEILKRIRGLSIVRHDSKEAKAQFDVGNNILERKSTSYYNISVHLWGAISLEGRSDLYFHESTVKTEAYTTCIKKRFYLHEGAKFHTSKVHKQFFQENDIEAIQNPLRSPDLAPIEMI